MRPPYSADQFLDVFRRYNEAVFPVQAVLLLIALLAIGGALRGTHRGARAAMSLLAVLWIWMGVAYHLAFFATLSSLGYVFAALFTLQGILLLRYATASSPPSFGARLDARGAAAAALVLYALLGYPLVAAVSGHSFPALPTFGVPCPTTIFTLGMLLWSTAPISRHLLVVPSAWAVLGITAIPAFGMWEDVGLLLAGTLTLVFLFRRTATPGESTGATRPPSAEPRVGPGWRARRIAASVVLLFIGPYLAYVSAAWLRYGHLPAAQRTRQTVMLDRYIPVYEEREVSERRVNAPAATTFSAACTIDLHQSRVSQALFGAREIVMLRRRPRQTVPRPFLHDIAALGWGMLAATPEREIVFGAVTKPWEGEVRFQALPATEFAAFDEPGYAKIVWSISVEPDGPSASRVRTETRVATTDAASRARFRRYWALASPGIYLIRREALALIEREAEHERAAAVADTGSGGSVERCLPHSHRPGLGARCECARDSAAGERNGDRHFGRLHPAHPDRRVFPRVGGT